MITAEAATVMQPCAPVELRRPFRFDNFRVQNALRIDNQAKTPVGKFELSAYLSYND
jgi:hypothetical protein